MTKIKVFLYYLIFTIGSFSTIIAQKKKTIEFIAPDMPVDIKTKLINYTEVVQVDGSKDELHQKALNWFQTQYSNPKEKIRKNNPDEGIIEGFIRFTIYNPEDKKGLKTDAGLVQYTISIYLKDDRFKYEVSNLNWKKTSYYPIEKWMDKDDRYYTPYFDYYLIQVNEEVQNVISSFKDFMVQDIDEDNEYR